MIENIFNNIIFIFFKMNNFLKKWHAPGYGDTPHQMTIIASPKNGEETRTIGWGPHQRLNKPPTHPVWVSSPSPGESDIPRKSDAHSKNKIILDGFL